MQRAFSDQEFEIMIFEMSDDTHPAFDALCAIAEKILRPKVRYWCRSDPVLYGRGMEDDIMQEILIRLIKTIVTHFLKRNGVVNRNPEEFQKWITTVAKNVQIDMAKALRNRDARVRGFVEGEQIAAPSAPDGEEDSRRETLAEAFRIVLDSDAAVYKILTWLAQSIFIIEYNVTKIRSNELIIAAFGERSLFEMRDMVLDAADNVEWISITDAQKARMDQALNMKWAGKAIGEIPYQEFFMKKGGKASISDWVNRMNKMIERQMTQ